MEGFIGEKEVFVVDAWSGASGGEWGLRWCAARVSAGENPGGKVLHILESVLYIVWYTGQDSIAVLQAGGDEVRACVSLFWVRGHQLSRRSFIQYVAKNTFVFIYLKECSYTSQNTSECGLVDEMSGGIQAAFRPLLSSRHLWSDHSWRISKSRSEVGPSDSRRDNAWTRDRVIC